MKTLHKQFFFGFIISFIFAVILTNFGIITTDEAIIKTGYTYYECAIYYREIIECPSAKVVESIDEIMMFSLIFGMIWTWAYREMEKKEVFLDE